MAKKLSYEDIQPHLKNLTSDDWTRMSKELAELLEKRQNELVDKKKQIDSELEVIKGGGK